MGKLYTTDEELGKRDDNYKPASHARPPWLLPLRWRRRRLAFGALALFCIWLFIHNIPTDLGSIDERMGHALRPGHSVAGTEFGYVPSGAGGGQKGQNGMPMGAPPRPSEGVDVGVEDGQEEHYYSGPIKFYKLASSLHAISRTMGHRPGNRNVLFAAASLASVADLLPMACEMARWDRNYVHLVLLGREAVPLEDVLEINGVRAETCRVYFHDGRADYSEYSTDVRAEVAVAGAMNHVNNFMHPQVIITDDSAVEEVFFVKGIRAKARDLGRPVIEVPKGKYEDFMWMTRLDSSSLAAWHKPSVNILIHAPPASAGSLLRCVRSLVSADYAGLSPPHLTIELPPEIDPFGRQYIEDLVWPPSKDTPGPRTSTLRLHHRISPAQSSTESTSIRFLESFYPSNPSDSHVLILSPQTELSPLYYHYLLYHILETRYAAYSSSSHENLFGISLATPSTHLNGSGPFAPPTLSDSTITRSTKATGTQPDDAVPFLWQAPSADAVLVFGDKWTELHSYLSNRLRVAHPPLGATKAAAPKRAKLVSELQPGWMEYMLELMRARAWSVLYPAAGTGDERWATVHQDLWQVPEEFKDAHARSGQQSSDDDEGLAPEVEGAEEPFLLAADPPPEKVSRDEGSVVQHSQPLHALLPLSGDGDTPELDQLPLLAYTGELVQPATAEDLASEYRQQIRRDVGGCEEKDAQRARKIFRGRADDLFCLPGSEGDYADQEDGDVAEAERIVDEDEDARAPGSYAGSGKNEKMPVYQGKDVETVPKVKGAGAATSSVKGKVRPGPIGGIDEVERPPAAKKVASNKVGGSEEGNVVLAKASVEDVERTAAKPAPKKAAAVDESEMPPAAKPAVRQQAVKKMQADDLA